MIIKESREERIVYVIITNNEPPSVPAEFAPKVHQILTNFSDIMPNELCDELSPPRDIKHAIDLAPESTLPNLPH